MNIKIIPPPPQPQPKISLELSRRQLELITALIGASNSKEVTKIVNGSLLVEDGKICPFDCDEVKNLIFNSDTYCSLKDTLNKL